MVRTLLIVGGVLLFTVFLSSCGKPVDLGIKASHPASVK